MKNIKVKFEKINKGLRSLIIYRINGISLVLFILFFLNHFNSSAQKYSFNITAKNNIESVNKEGRIYFLEIQNNTKEEMEVKLSIFNKNAGKNPDETDSRNNVYLTASFLNEEGREMEGKVVLKANGLLKFQVKVTVPEGTPIEHWNTLLVNAVSDKTTSYSSSLILYTFIPNPEEK